MITLHIFIIVTNLGKINHVGGVPHMYEGCDGLRLLLDTMRPVVCQRSCHMASKPHHNTKQMV